MAFRRPNSIITPVLTGHSLNSGLAGWWLCLPNWMGGTTWIDLCNRNPGTLTSMLNSSNGWRPSQRPGGFGQLLFDGSAGFVNCGAPALFNLTSGWTLAAWVNITGGAGTFRGVMSKFIGGTDINYDMYVSSANHVYCESTIGGSAKSLQGATSLSLNTRYHFAAKYDGVALSVYLNGARDGTSAQSGTCATTADPLFIGKTHSGGEFFPGSIDDCRLFSRGLSDIEIFDLFNDSRNGYHKTLYRAGRRFGRAASVSPLPPPTTTNPFYRPKSTQVADSRLSSTQTPDSRFASTQVADQRRLQNNEQVQ